MSFFSVITTIQEPTNCVDNLVKALNEENGKLVVIGDSKGPRHYKIDGVEFYDLASQLELPFSLSQKLPLAHYSRKNLGYLLAIEKGASCIYETDDDNEPLASWQKRSEYVTSTITLPTRYCEKNKTGKWFNIYSLFTEVVSFFRPAPWCFKLTL